jgi:uncharacterized protein
MVRLLLLLVIVGVVAWWVLGRSRRRAADAPSSPRKPVSFAVCAHCGVHLPTHEAIVDDGKAYCSEAHRLAGPKDRSAP